MKKNVLNKFLRSAGAIVLAAGVLAGCGSTANQTAQVEESEVAKSAGEEAPAAETVQETEAAEAAVEEKGTITVAASQTPHSEILAQAAEILKEQGWDLQVTVFDDYVQPNNVVESEEFDANYFQHIPYLNSFNEEQGTHLVNAGGIHYEPFGIYAGTKSSLDELADGDEIAVPNDTTNEARALLLLQDNGILTLREGAGLTATVNDIESYNTQVKIIELAAESVKDAIPDAAFVVLNGNYALEAGLSVGKDALAYEANDSEAAQTYVNVIAVKEGHENDEKIKALIEVLKSDAIKQFIVDTYDGAVVPFN
ncbi:MAG: MetQ/NlpA family ABC transporter substrate-binding protein [Lachnospiraceae bacterium]|nr:MetQ/NlpA family ABC transporter substrate-binding protein [Lachnospiraceae bacterium]